MRAGRARGTAARRRGGRRRRQQEAREGQRVGVDHPLESLKSPPRSRSIDASATLTIVTSSSSTQRLCGPSFTPTAAAETTDADPAADGRRTGEGGWRAEVSLQPARLRLALRAPRGSTTRDGASG